MAAYRNWVTLDAAGRALWVIFAPSRDEAVRLHPGAADARPAEMTAGDLALSKQANDSYGKLD
jgi:hypothetical protein